MKCDFDELIRKREDIKAIRYFANEYYDNGKMGYTRKLLIERVADENEKLKKQKDKVKVEMEKMPNTCISLRHCMENKLSEKHKKQFCPAICPRYKEGR